MKPTTFIGILILVLLLALSFWGGISYHKKIYVCPEITSDTVVIHDVITHTIIDTFPFYQYETDTIIVRDTVYGPIDTSGVLRDYFSKHVYKRTWADSLLLVDVLDVVSENKFVHNEFKYKILRPQTVVNNVIDNTTSYSKYVYFGLNVPIKNFNYLELEAMYAFRKGYAGISYSPELKSVGIKAGVTLIKLK